MSIRNLRILWFKIKTDKTSHFTLTFPIPIYIFNEILDCGYDFFSLLCWLAPNGSKRIPTSSSLSPYAIKHFIELTIQLLDSISEEEPYELVNVAADNVKVSIQFK